MTGSPRLSDCQPARWASPFKLPSMLTVPMFSKYMIIIWAKKWCVASYQLLLWEHYFVVPHSCCRGIKRFCMLKGLNSSGYHQLQWNFECAELLRIDWLLGNAPINITCVVNKPGLDLGHTLLVFRQASSSRAERTEFRQRPQELNFIVPHASWQGA